MDFQWQPMVGLIVGAALSVLYPYLRKGLEDIAGGGTQFPLFDWRYPAAIALPLAGYVVMFVTTEGLWAAFLRWSFVQAAGAGFAQTILTVETVKGGLALVQIVNNGRHK